MKILRTEPTQPRRSGNVRKQPGARLLAAWILCVAGPAVALPTETPAAQRADTIYLNGRILTGEGLNGTTPSFVSALAIANGRIVLAGSDAAALRTKSGETRMVDLHGAFVMPGFNDAHVHLASAGRTRLSIDLIGCISLDDMLQRVHAAAERAPRGSWLRGRGWDHTLWPSGQLPTAADLDRVTAGHPAVLVRVDGHIAVANSAALKALGIHRHTADPPGGRFDRDSTGEPTGIARETAKEQITAMLPSLTDEERRQALQLAIDDAISHGITSVQDYSSWEDFKTYERMEQAGALPLRITEWLSFSDPLPLLVKRRNEHPKDDPLLNTGMLKGFMDGSLGSRTAALFAPYADDPANSGIPQFEQDTLDRMTIERTRAGFQIGFHAIGDKATAMALNAFAAAEATVPNSRNLRFRIEHAQVVASDDFQRFARLGVIASMQPNHLLSDMRWAFARLGPDRAPHSYAWRSMLDHGVHLAFGTDYPVEPVTPFRGIYAAITRMPEPAGETLPPATAAYFPVERLTLQQALYAYTQGAAYAQNMERSKGRLLEGYLADFIVLDRDLSGSTPQEILGTQVLQTVVGGRVVFEYKHPAGEHALK